MKPGDVIRAQLVFSNIPMAIKPDDYIPMRPIPITERLPKPYNPSIAGPQDCDPMGRCWGIDVLNMWILVNVSRLNRSWLAWLPHWAISLPEVES